MSNATEQRAFRSARIEKFHQRLTLIESTFPGINRHHATQVAFADRLWGVDELWRDVAACPVGPCLLSCCNPTT